MPKDFCGRYGPDSHHFPGLEDNGSCLCGVWQAIADDLLQANVYLGRCRRCGKPLDEHPGAMLCTWVRNPNTARDDLNRG